MKKIIVPILIVLSLNGCQQQTNPSIPENPIIGTWQLLSGTTIEKGDTTITDYTQGLKGLKMINATHFAFFQHDLTQGKDSIKIYSSGGGPYTLIGDQYKEHLEYCQAREWENHDFEFTISIQQDTLTQQGVEKVESLGIERINIEKYIRVK